ncbi:hypothetical protein [Aliivibrio fischeri]|uniref:hypothetical protein n=1 Tax=Aliivibrio fischeri TaxID=668 RepID=UPI0009080263|nr:hypothetical protein [Aliivibrio fischeri]
MISIRSINFILIMVIIIGFLLALYGTSLSCDYNMTIKTEKTIYNGVCQFGKASWIEQYDDPVNGSTWYVESFSFSYGNHLIYIIINREQVHKSGKNLNPLDIFNIQAENIQILRYEYYDMFNNKLALFSTFPEEHIYIAKMSGQLSLFSSKKNTLIPIMH